MKILFLDDNYYRCESFLRSYPGITRVVHTASEAIAALHEQRDGWVSIWLDHDLGGVAFEPSDTNSGMEVVRHMVKNPVETGAVVIHSWNIPAAQRMASELRKAGYVVRQIPFGGE